MLKKTDLGHLWSLLGVDCYSSMLFVYQWPLPSFDAFCPASRQRPCLWNSIPHQQSSLPYAVLHWWPCTVSDHYDSWPLGINNLCTPCWRPSPCCCSLPSHLRSIVDFVQLRRSYSLLDLSLQHLPLLARSRLLWPFLELVLWFNSNLFVAAVFWFVVSHISLGVMDAKKMVVEVKLIQLYGLELDGPTLSLEYL